MKSILLFIFFCIVSYSLRSQCASSSTNSPAAAVSQAFTGSKYFFSNGDSVFLSDNKRASATVLISVLSGPTERLVATNFGFNIPLNASICGVVAEVQKGATNINILTSVQDNQVYLVKAGAIAGNNKALAGNWPTTNVYYTYGANNDLWGTTLTPAEVNASDFGIALSANLTGIISLFPFSKIDHIRLTVYYDVPLPIHLIAFNIKIVQSKPELSWVVSEMEPGTKFSIERSADASSWNEIHTTNYDGRYLELSIFRYTDDQPLSGNSFYRLRIVEADGRTIISPVRSFVSRNIMPVVYPNPSKGDLYIRNIVVGSRLVIYDQVGRSYSLPVLSAGQEKRINISLLSKGVYFIKTGARTLSFIKQ